MSIDLNQNEGKVRKIQRLPAKSWRYLNQTPGDRLTASIDQKLLNCRPRVASAGFGINVNAYQLTHQGPNLLHWETTNLFRKRLLLIGPDLELLANCTTVISVVL